MTTERHLDEPGEGAATDPSGPTGRLATWLAAATLDDIPPDVRDRAKHLLLDGLCCLMVGSRLPWSETGVRAILQMDGLGTSMLAGWGVSTSPPSAAMLNSSFIQGFELDDYYPPAPLHSNSIILPALIAAAPLVRTVTGADFLLATILGYEVGTRLGLALHGGEMLSRGWHSGVVFGGPAAAAAVGKLHGLSAAGFEDALGIAATQSCGLMSAQFESMVKRMQHGFAARNGLYAAILAASGYVGIKRVFEREYGGYLSVFGEGHSPDPTQIALGLGSRWNTEQIAVKPYAAMGGLHASVDAVLSLREERQIDPDEVESVLVHVGDAAFKHGGFPIERPVAPVTAQMSLRYTVAVALLDGDALMKQFSSDRLNADDVWKLIGKTDVRHDPTIESESKNPYTTRVALRFKDGANLERTVETPRGGLDRPLTNGDIKDKYEALSASVMDKRRRDSIRDLTLNLDSEESVLPLLRLLVATVTNPL